MCALFERLTPWADQLPNNGIGAESPVSHYLGGLATVLGRYDEADDFFTDACRSPPTEPARSSSPPAPTCRGG